MASPSPNPSFPSHLNLSDDYSVHPTVCFPNHQLWTASNSTFYAVQPGQQIDVAAFPSPFQGVEVDIYEDANPTQLPR